jgi:alkylation response protein AidB-like acyl-CoA dehydrogenase
MDFSLSDEQTALGDLAKQILADGASHERLSALERDGGAVDDRELWAQLASSGVLAAALPEEHGGSGLGIGALLGVLEAVGWHVAPVPFVPTVVLGALSLARYGSAEQQARLLPGVGDGSVILTAALEEPWARADGDSLTGDVGGVAYAAQARAVLVATDAGVYLVDPAADGVTITQQLTTNRQPIADLSFDGVAAQLLTDDPEAAVWMTQLGAAATCAVQAGVCRGALRMTSEHTASRQQFGKPIAEFQAVAQRAADAFIDTEMIRLTAWQALFRLDQGWPASKEVHVAKFWAGDGGMRVVHATQHLHGGLGVDTSYPVHRYFLWAKQNEHTLGTPTRELIKLGAVLADEPI